MSDAIVVKDLSKEYKSFKRRPGISGSFRDLISRRYEWTKAVDSISFTVKEGEILGYIGPNGAGKSTSIKMLTGILQPTSGEISVVGFHPFRDRKIYTRHLGVVFGQRTQLWWDIAVRESFSLLGKIYEIPEAEFNSRLKKLTSILDLDRLLSTPVRKLSLGERMRCDLTASLLHNPKVLFLDEPTIGLDAVGKENIRSFLKQVNRDFGTTILLTTHDLKEIEELCKRIIILDKGKILYDGSLEKIKALPGVLRTAVVEFSSEVSEEQLQLTLGANAQLESQTPRRYLIKFDAQKLSPPDLVRNLFSNYTLHDISVSEASIEQIIIKMYRESEG